MKVELNEQECHNVRVALRLLAKQPDVNEQAMKEILILSDKFLVSPLPVKKKPEVKKEA